MRRDFPILNRPLGNGSRLAYLDNAATTQKPRVVIDTITRFYECENANIHRGVHTLSAEATAAYETARETVQKFINANSNTEIVFTSGTTDSINLVAHSLSQHCLKPGDEILITELEHHSNIVPWQIIAQTTQAKLTVAHINDAGEVPLDEFKSKLTERTKIVSISHISNALGTINPVKEMTQAAHDAGAYVLVDGAQATAHLDVDVIDIDCDFYAFSGHKVFGPTGTGVLYGKESLLEVMPPYRSGGDMIKEVRLDSSTYNDLPYKFEAGTPNIAGNIGLGAALEYVAALDLKAASAHEDRLLAVATAKLQEIDGLRVIGMAANKTSVLSFTLNDVHPHDLGTLLDNQGVAIRTGHHCAMPVMQRFGLEGTARASFAAYNNDQDVEQFIQAMNKSLMMLR
ncbi:MAG: aminotransferase class V-fold PLP-dependent enzyme [Gammaproteobacteria bacterium]